MIADSSDKVLTAFAKYDLNRASMVRREQLKNILNDLLLKHGQGKTTATQVPAQVQAELWEKTTGNQNEEVILADYAQTVHKAQEILLQKMQETEAQRKKIQGEIDVVRSLLERTKRQENEEEAQRLTDRLRHLGLNSMKYDEEMEGIKEDLALLTIIFQFGEGVQPSQNITPMQPAPGVTAEQDITNKTVHNSSLQNISLGNPVNVSHQVNRSAGSQRSILDTSAQRVRNMSLLNAKDLANRHPPPIYVQPVAPVHMVQMKEAVPVVVDENVVTTVAHSPFADTSILHRESPRPYEGAGGEYHSRKLYCIFWLSTILLLLELFQLMEKPLMLGLLFSLSIIGMFVLHRFSPSNVKYTITIGLLSILLDIIWLAVKAKTFLTTHCGWACYFNIYRANHKWPYEVHHIKLHLAIVITLFVGLLLKLVISILLCWFRRQSEQDNERSIRLFGHQLIISDQAYAANPQGYGYSPQQPY